VFNEKKFQSLISIAIPGEIVQLVVIPSHIVQPVQNPPRAMEARFSPLVLPAQLHDLPQTYNRRIKSYDVEENVSSQKHLDWFNDFSDLRR